MDLQRLIVKVGTNVLTRPNGRLDVTNISQLCDQMAQLKQAGKEVILVSSGAVGAGQGLLQLSKTNNEVVQRQVLSAIGQVHLMELYRQLLANHGIHCAQVLATKNDFSGRRHYLHMRNCLEGLLAESNVLPIINENDVISISELMFTDNDELASLVAALLHADGLVILSSVDGLLDGSPEDPASQLIKEIPPDDATAAQVILPTKSSFGRGGMLTKFHLAQKAASLGTHVYIANGRHPHILTNILKGKANCTHFIPKPRSSNIKTWMAHQANSPLAKIWVNQGAQKAIMDSQQANSLLPIGIEKIEGEFTKGALIHIYAQDGKAFAMGMAQYDHEEAQAYIGLQGKRALVHYDYLVLIKN